MRAPAIPRPGRLDPRLRAFAATACQRFVAAPVFGRPNVAQEGRLWVAMSGAEKAVSRARPILEPLARGISIVGYLGRLIGEMINA